MVDFSGIVVIGFDSIVVMASVETESSVESVIVGSGFESVETGSVYISDLTISVAA